MDDNGNQNGNGKPADSFGGSGGRNARADSGLTEIRDSRLLGRAIRGNWLHGTRWSTEATPEQLQEVSKQRGLTMKERAAIAVLSDVASGEARIRQIAVRNIISMEAQNQADEHKATPDLHLHAHKNLDQQPDGTVQKLASLAEEFEQVAGQDLLEE